MFARIVSMRLKANTSRSDFSQTIEREIIPVLRKQKGFQDEITFVDPSGTEVVGISLWDQKENAELYSRGAYPEVVLKTLTNVVEGTPEVRSFEVANSTFHRIAAPAVVVAA